MKNIYINARFLTQQITGVQRYAREVVKSLDDLVSSGEVDGSRYNFTLLAPQRGVEEIPPLRNILLKQAGSLSGHAWEQVELPRLARDGTLVNLCNTGPLSYNNQLVTIHDAAVYAFPEAYSFFFKTWYRHLYKRLGKRARKIITVSHFSKTELIRYCDIRPENIEVIYEGKEHIFSVEPDDSILHSFDLVDKPFILAVSSLSPHKNFQAVIKAIELLRDTPASFVIAGGTNPKVFSSTETALPSNVIHVGYVSDAQLRALYEKAVCFVFPSLYEGFGLPPLEAMACGCPVLASNAASLPEVCNDAALFFNPTDPAEIAFRIKQVITDTDIYHSLRQKGLDRSKQFSWEACARKTFNVIKDVIC